MTSGTKTAKREAPPKPPKTYGKEQGYKDRRVPMRTPADTIRAIWEGTLVKRKKPIRRITPGI